MGILASGQAFSVCFRPISVPFSPLQTTIRGAYGLKARTSDLECHSVSFLEDFNPPT